MIGNVGGAAAYGGFLEGRKAHQSLDMGDIQLKNAEIEQQGTEALGNAIKLFQQQVPGAQPMGGAPQSPMPGQSSQPMARPPQQAAQPQNLPTPPPQNDPTWTVGANQAGAAPPTGGPPSFDQRFGGGQQQAAAPAARPAAPAAPQQPAQAPAQQGDQLSAALQQSPMAGRLGLGTIMSNVVKANPGASPQVIAAAVTKALPLMNAQAQMDWKTSATALSAGRLQESQTHHRAQEGTSQQNADTRAAGQQSTADYREHRLGQMDTKQAFAETQAALRNDQRYQQLEQQKQRLEQSGQRLDLAQTRAIIDAQHKRAMEIIQTSSVFNGMPPEEKKALLAEQDRAYKEQIMQLKARALAPNAQKPAASTAAPGQAPQRQQFRNKSTGAMEDFELQDGKWVPVK